MTVIFILCYLPIRSKVRPIRRKSTFSCFYVIQYKRESEVEYMDMIKTIGLTKTYGKLTAVDKLDLTIEQGTLFALLGVNGAGKTTTIKMLTCIANSTQGDAFVGGYSINKDPEKVKGLIGVSPQETAIASNLSVRENLELMCGIFGFSKEKTASKIRELSEKFDLLSILDKKADKLSGGWKRRVSIAMALISEPKILFLDEPTLGVDVIARHELWDVIRGLKGRSTIILTTHYMEEAEALSDCIGVMKNGRLLAVGTCDELKEMTRTNNFESAFVSLVKGESR